MASSTPLDNPPKTEVHTSFNTSAQARNYGIILGVLTAVYLIILNLVYTEGVPFGLRFAKHLLIIPVVWMAAANYAKRLPDGELFKAEIAYLMRLAAYAAITVVAANIVMYLIAGEGFEQFMQQGETFAGVMINSGFLFFETVVFVMIIAFILLQGFKGGGSPED